MAAILDRLAARIAYWHARRVYGGFRRTLERVEATQQRALREVLATVRDSEYARRYDLQRVRTPDDLRRAAPLITYEHLRPTMERVLAGEFGALFAPSVNIRMFATSSGTTAQPKYIPVPDAFVRHYRRGWNTFGLKMLGDHPAAILRAILQVSGKHDESLAPCGLPCGAITGLLAQTQKGIVRRYYVGVPDIVQLRDPVAKYYTLMRFGVVRDVAFAITANPATLIRLAQTGNDHSEQLVRDVRDGTLSGEIVADRALRARLEALLRPAPSRARELESLREQHGRLQPRDYWRTEFLACWTGGSMGHYLATLADWWGPAPVRDIGLLASEGRVTVPLDDNTPIGVLDAQGAVFEFIPHEQWDQPDPDTLLPHELTAGVDYVVVLSNTAGLLRYRLDDVVRCHGRIGGAPLLEFLHRAGRVASVAGEKLTENQVVAAVKAASVKLGVLVSDFVLAPRWGDPPHYRLCCPLELSADALALLDAELGQQNDEYASRRNSVRLGPLQSLQVGIEQFQALDRRLSESRGATTEQYKRPCLLTDPDEDYDLLKSPNFQK